MFSFLIPVGASLILGVSFVRCIFFGGGGGGRGESMAGAQPGGIGVKELLS